MTLNQDLILLNHVDWMKILTIDTQQIIYIIWIKSIFNRNVFVSNFKKERQFLKIWWKSSFDWEKTPQKIFLEKVCQNLSFRQYLAKLKELLDSRNSLFKSNLLKKFLGNCVYFPCDFSLLFSFEIFVNFFLTEKTLCSRNFQQIFSRVGFLYGQCFS